MANKNYTATDVLLVKHCKPLFKVLKSEFQEIRCNTCFIGDVPLARCETCKAVFYCGKGCRTLDIQNGHGLECKTDAFRHCLSRHTMEKDQQVALFRLFALIYSVPEIRNRIYTMPNGYPMSFYDPCSFRPLMSPRNIVTSMVQALRWVIPPLTYNQLMKLYGIYTANAIEILDERVVVGYGIFDQDVMFHRQSQYDITGVLRGTDFQLWTTCHVSGNLWKFQSWSMTVRDVILFEQDSDNRSSALTAWVNSQLQLNYKTPVDYCKISWLSASFSSIMEEYFWGHADKRADEVIKLHNELMMVLELGEDLDPEIKSVQQANFAIFAPHLGGFQDDLTKLHRDAKKMLNLTFGRDSWITNRFCRYFYTIPYGNLGYSTGRRRPKRGVQTMNRSRAS